MSWIEIIPYVSAAGKLRQLYDRIKGPDDTIDNIMRVHSLRPHTMAGHMALYKNALHHRENTLPVRTLEIIGLYVSLLNGCEYCVEHHFAGLRRLLADDALAESIRAALETGEVDAVFDARMKAVLSYAEALTLRPAEMRPSWLAAMRAAGMTDGEILEVNQVVAYFAYANRTALGLGVTTEGEVLGLSPGDTTDPDNWRHA